MTSNSRRSAFSQAALFALPTFLMLFFACSDDGVAPPETRASGILKLNGDVQQGVVAAALPDSLFIRVTDSGGRGVAGVPVLWEITSGGGVAAGAALTSASGEAKAMWTLGTTAGENALTVRAGAATPIVFSAVATPDVPFAIHLASDSLTLTAPGETRQLTAAVVDKYDNTIPQPAITWSVSDTLVASVSATGVVSARRTGDAELSALAGSATGTIPLRVRFVVTAIEMDVASGTLNALGDTLRLAPTARNAEGGAEQATFTWSTSDANVASVTAEGAVIATGAGSAVIRAAVGNVADSTTIEVRQVLASATPSASSTSLSAGDSTTISVVAADSNGVAIEAASTTWSTADSSIATIVAADDAAVIRGGRAGTTQLTASVSAPASSTIDVSVNVSVTPAAASALERVAGDGQAATVGNPVPDALVVRVSDAYGNAVAGATVRWSATSGGGSLPDSSIADANGYASAVWTLGAAAGANSAAATVGNATATFSASAAPMIGTAGGTISTPDGEVTISVPPGAVAGSTPFTIRRTTDDSGDPDVVGAVYDFGPSGTQFPVPVTVALKFDPAELHPDSLDEDIIVEVQEDEGGEWLFIDGSGVDTIAGMVTAELPHFSKVKKVKIKLTVEGETDLEVGQTTSIHAKLKKVTGGGKLNPSKLKWESSNTAVATVHGDGADATVTARAAGETDILASYKRAKTRSVEIVVREPPPPVVAKVEILGAEIRTAATASRIDLVARASSSSGAPVSGATIDWGFVGSILTVSQISPSSSVTNASGEATTTLTLGTHPHELTVEAVDQSTTSSDQVTILAEEPVASSLLALSATALTGTVGTFVQDEPTVQVKDQFGNPLSGASVEFVVTAGSGTLTGAKKTTGADGKATVGSWTLGTAPGANKLEARVKGLDPIIFTATASAGAATRLVLSGAATQSAGSAQTVTITARDDYGNIAATYEGQKSLEFGGASASPSGDDPTATNTSSAAIEFGDPTTVYFTDGVATTKVTLFNAESALLEVSDGTVDSPDGDRLSVTVNAPGTSRYVLVLAPTQTSGVPFTGTNTLTAIDDFGNTVTASYAEDVLLSTELPGVIGGFGNPAILDWISESVNGVADLTGKIIYTGPAGVGTFTARALAAGIGGISGSVTINAAPAAATKLGLVTQASDSVRSGIVFTRQPSVQLQDGSGNPIATAGVDVTVALTGGGTLAGQTTVQTDATGLATFTDLAISGTIGERVLTFSADGLTSAVDTLELVAGEATRFVLTGSAGQTAGDEQEITIAAQDAFGNVATGYEGSIILTFSGASAIANLYFPTARNSNNLPIIFGTHTELSFADGETTTKIELVKSETASIHVTDGIVSTEEPLEVTVAPDVLRNFYLNFASEQTSGVPFTGTNTVTALDAFQNVITDFDASVTNVTLTTNLTGTIGGLGSGGGAVLDQASDFVDGVADLTGKLTYTGAGGAGTFTATAGSWSGTTLGNVTVNAAATQLGIVTPAADAARSGSVLARQPAVQLQDESGDPVATAGVDVTVTLTGGGTLAGQTTVQTDAAGLATFTDLAISGIVGERMLTFNATGLTGAVDTLELVAGRATRFVLTGDAAWIAGVADTVTITATDAAGNVAADYGTGEQFLVFSGASNAPNGTRPFARGWMLEIVGFGAHTSTYFDSGIARTAVTFVAVEDVTLAVTDGNISSSGEDRLQLGVSAGEFENLQLVLSEDQQNGVPFTGTNTLTAMDLYRNVITDFDASVNRVKVELALNNDLEGSITGLGSAGDSILNRRSDFVNGVATLTGALTYTGVAGTGKFIAFAVSKDVDSNARDVTVTPGTATAMTITTQPPATAESGVVFTPQPEVQLEDLSGNDVRAAGVSVSAILDGAGELDGDTEVLTDADGVAKFTDLSISGGGGIHTLIFSSDGLTPAESNEIDVSFVDATQLGFIGDPPETVVAGEAFSLQVAFQDADGNTFTAATGEVELSTGESASAVNGVATFTGLTLETAGEVEIVATGTDVTDASLTIEVEPAEAAELVFIDQPANSVAGDPFSPAIKVAIQDEFGNRIATTDEVTLSIETNNGDPAARLVGDTVVSAESGFALFNGVSLQIAGNGYTISASAPGLPEVVSDPFNITAGEVTQLLVTGPPAAFVGLPYPLASVFADQYGNPRFDLTATVNVTTDPVGGATGTFIVNDPNPFFFLAGGVYTVILTDPVSGLSGSFGPVDVVNFGGPPPPP